jgi:hypothetical protein
VLDTTYGTNGFLNGTQAYTFTVTSLSNASGITVFKGSEVLDYGTSGSGLIKRTTLDSAGSPYMDIDTWVTDPSISTNHTVHARLGNLSGIANCSGYGLYSNKAFLTESILVGDLTKAGNYMEYAGNALNIHANLYVTGGNAATNDSVNTAVNNIQVGGTNLFGFNKGILFGMDVPDSNINGYHCYYSSSNLLGRIQNLGFAGVGGDFTVSFYAKASVSLVVNVNLCDVGTDNSYTNLTDTYTKFVYVFKNVFGYVGTDMYGFLDIENTGDVNAVVDIKNIKIERGTKATDWSPAPEDVKGYTDTSIANIQIGGTNLLLNSDFHDGLNHIGNVINGGTIHEINTDSLYGHVFRTTAGIRLFTNIVNAGIKTGDYMTVSFYALGANGSEFQFAGIGHDSGDTLFPGQGWETTTAGWKKYTYTAQALTNQVDDLMFYLYVNENGADDNRPVVIANVKFEVGNKATAWCLAPSETPTTTAIQAAFSLSGDNISLFGKTIDITGATVFSSIQQNTKVTVDATGLDPNTYYPVTIFLNTTEWLYSPSTILVKRGLDATYGVPSYATHSQGFSVSCSWQTNGNGWGSMTVKRIINSYENNFSTVIPIGSINQLGNSSQEFIYVRGGSKYDVQINKPNVEVTLRTSAYTDYSGQTINLLTSVVAPVDDLTTGKTNLATNIGYTSYDAMVSAAAAQQTLIDGGYLRNALIQTNAIIADKIAAGAVTADKITTGAVTADKIAAGAITADKIAAQSITTAKLSADLFDGNYINANYINATTVFTNALTAGTIYAGNAVINGLKVTNATVSGTLSAVSGTFSSLSPIHSGTAQGSMNFDSTYGMCFNDLDIGQQGQRNNRGLRFYSSDIRCRGMFGAYEKSMVYITGSTARYYPNGYSTTDYVTVSLQSTGTGAYYIPLFPGTSSAGYDGSSYVGNPTVYGHAIYADLNGLPIDLVVINNFTTYRYTLVGNTGKHVTVVNSCDTMECYITTNGNTDWKLWGGAASEWVNLYGLITPSRTNEGAGWLCTGVNDNNWN